MIRGEDGLDDGIDCGEVNIMNEKMRGLDAREARMLLTTVIEMINENSSWSFHEAYAHDLNFFSSKTNVTGVQ